MLNFELARIVIAERRRKTDENLRQAGFRLALADRNGSQRTVESGSAESAQACNETGQRTKPALG